MAHRIPEPERTTEGPTYEGRRLARPDDEVVDQGAGFDIGTLISRRGLLSLVGLGIGATALAACSSSTSSSTTTAAPTATLRSPAQGRADRRHRALRPAVAVRAGRLRRPAAYQTAGSPRQRDDST
jgi:hypothetical protein